MAQMFVSLDQRIDVTQCGFVSALLEMPGNRVVGIPTSLLAGDDGFGVHALRWSLVALRTFCRKSSK